MNKANKFYRDALGRIKLYGVVLAVIGLMCAQLAYIQSLERKVDKTEAHTAEVVRQTEAFRESHCSGKEKIQQGTATYAIKSTGYDRVYHVHVPASYRPNERTAAIVNYDGIDGGGIKMEGYSNVDSLPVIAIYPDSLMGTSGFTAWQGAPYSLSGNYDVQFTKDMLSDVKQRYCVDESSVFAIGMSNGGGFAVIANCQLPNTFRAIASLSGAYYTGCEGNVKPGGSLLALHSVTDPQVPFQGSSTKGVPAITDWAAQQAKARSCQSSKRKTDIYGSEQYEWSKCDQHAKVRLLVLQGQSHGWLAMPQTPSPFAPNTASYIWSFFKATMSDK